MAAKAAEAASWSYLTSNNGPQNVKESTRQILYQLLFLFQDLRHLEGLSLFFLLPKNPQLKEYIEKSQSIGGVWAGSQEAQIGVGALVDLGLISQEQSELLLYYRTPELPS